MRQAKVRKIKRGLSLIETLVVTGLFSAISLFTVVLFTTAMGDFEHANVKISMNTYARRASSSITSIISTAAARRPGTPVPEAFYCPTDISGTTEETYCDFLSTSNFIKTSTTEVSYAFDDGSPATGYTPVFRYRLAWTGTPIGNIPRNSVYLERLNLDQVPASPAIGSAAPIAGYRQLIANNISACTFRRTFAGTVQVRVLVYAYDPVTGRGLDGSVMRSMTKRRRQDVTGTEKSYELLTSIPLPTLNIK